MKKTVLHTSSLFALVMPMSLYAVGLGNMTVKSALDQPFSAEIELIDVGSTPLPGIKVGLADSENFEQIGLERRAVLSLLSFKTVRTSTGQFIILVQSQERMTEPYMEIVVDLTWPKGQLYKAYTVLLDPPGYQLVSTKAQSSPAYYHKPIIKQSHEPGVIDKTVTTTVARNPAELNDNKKNATYGPTATHENVWQIAQRYKTSEVILPQVVLAIVGANPQAFSNDNLNGLKAGIKLNIPSTDEILLIPADLATEEVMAHDKAWNEKTAIIHVLSPPYMNGQPANATAVKTSPTAGTFQIPAISSLITQSRPAQQNVKNTDLIKTALPVIHSEQFNAIPNHVQSQSSEQYATTKAELAITTAAVESVRESNAVLMEQLRVLQDHNKKLQQQLDKRDKELEKIHTQMDVLMKERLAIAAQVSSIKSSGFSLGYWPLWLLLFMVAGGSGGAYWYLRLRKSKETNTSPYLTNIAKKPEPFVPLMEPAPLKSNEVSVAEMEASVSTVSLAEEASVDGEQSSHNAVEDEAIQFEPAMGVSADDIETRHTTLPADELDNNEPSSHQALEFETGLHRLITEKARSEAKEIQHDEDKGLEFVPSLDDNTKNETPDVAVSDSDENMLTFEVERDNQSSATFENNEHQPAESATGRLSEIDQSITEFFVEPVEVETIEVEHISDIDGKPSSPLKSTKALNTLLDLARTYISMDDFESAKNSLSEVLAHGDDLQKEEAQRLLAQMNDKP